MLPWHITGGQEHRRTASSALAVQCCHGRKGSGYGKGGDTYVPSGDCPRLPHCHCFHLHPVQSHPLALGGGVAGRAAGRQAAGALTPGRLAGLLATCRQVGILLQVLAYSTGGMPAAGPVASGRLAVLLATCADRRAGLPAACRQVGEGTQLLGGVCQTARGWGNAGRQAAGLAVPGRLAASLLHADRWAQR
eukprot:scaffold23278_cov16-Tisochrysis_lutea.AAC.1